MNIRSSALTSVSALPSTKASPAALAAAVPAPPVSAASPTIMVLSGASTRQNLDRAQPTGSPAAAVVSAPGVVSVALPAVLTPHPSHSASEFTVLSGATTEPAFQWTGAAPMPATFRSSDGISRLIQVAQTKEANDRARAEPTQAKPAWDLARDIAIAITSPFTRTATAKAHRPDFSPAGPRTPEATAAAAAGGIADLVGQIISTYRLNVTPAQQAQLKSTLERVVGDVCSKAKAGDDLVGNIRAAVGLSMWGTGISQDAIAFVTDGISAVLPAWFPGDAPTALREMGQFFASHSGADILGNLVSHAAGGQP